MDQLSVDLSQPHQWLLAGGGDEGDQWESNGRSTPIVQIGDLWLVLFTSGPIISVIAIVIGIIPLMLLMAIGVIPPLALGIMLLYVSFDERYTTATNFDGGTSSFSTIDTADSAVGRTFFSVFLNIYDVWAFSFINFAWFIQYMVTFQAPILWLQYMFQVYFSFNYINYGALTYNFFKDLLENIIADKTTFYEQYSQLNQFKVLLQNSLFTLAGVNFSIGLIALIGLVLFPITIVVLLIVIVTGFIALQIILPIILMTTIFVFWKELISLVIQAIVPLYDGGGQFHAEYWWPLNLISSTFVQQ